MSTQVRSGSTATGRGEAPWVSGLRVFAGTILLIAGGLHALAGFAAVINDDLYVATPNYIYAFDLTAWGWAHLLLGVLVAAVGVAVLQGQTWGRVAGIVLAAFSLVANFLFIPWFPIWALLIIALDVAVIWALAVQRGEPA